MNSIQQSYDASGSWNGFNHQGKLAMYVAIKKMNEITNHEMNDFDLEIEYLEDFSILKNKEYLTIHQVKSFKENSAKTHTNAIWTLLDIMNSFVTIEASYLHVTSEISDSIKLKDILKEEMDNFILKTGENIQQGVKKKSPIECMIDIKEANNFEKLFAKFKIYEYPDKKKFCALNDIDALLKNQIKLFIGKPFTEERIDRTFFHLLGLIDKNIRENHHNNQTVIRNKRKKIIINFNEIYNILNKNYEHFSLEFASYYLKNEFERITDEYLNITKDDFKYGDISEEEFYKIKAIVNTIFTQINKLSNEDFINFCLAINPTNQVNKDISNSTPSLLALMSQDNIQQSFLEALKFIKNKLTEGKWIHTHRNVDGENINYLPSTIINNNKKSEHMSVIHKIIHNPHNEFLMEVDVIITKELKNVHLNKFEIEIIKNVDDPETSMQAIEKYYKKINKINKIRLIDLHQASEELTND